MVRKVLLFVLVLLTVSLQAQDASSDKKKKKKANIRYYTIDKGVGNYIAKDAFNTSIYSSGYGFVGGFSIEKIYDHKITQSIQRFDLGALNLTNVVFNFNQIGKEYWRWKNFKSGDLYLGYCYDALFNNRIQTTFINNSLSYEWGASFAISTHFEKAFRWKKRNFLFTYQADLPLINYIYRPHYVSSNIPSVEEDEDFTVLSILTGGEVLTPIHWTAFSNQTALMMRIKNDNAIRLSYDWQVYKYQKEDPSFFAAHRLVFSLMVNL